MNRAAVALALTLLPVLAPRLEAQQPASKSSEGAAPAQAAPTLDAAARDQVVRQAAQLLLSGYVFPEVARTCADHLVKQLEAKAFEACDTPQALGAALTREIQAITHDKHLRVTPQRRFGSRPTDSGPMRSFMEGLALEASNFGVRRVEVLEGNIGYLELTGWSPLPLCQTKLEAAMRLLGNVDALVIDERVNGGGSAHTVQFLSSYFFDKPTHLNTIFRRGEPKEEVWTLPEVPGTRMAKVPLYVLTSARTFSAAEEFVNNLKPHKRATIIGETTGGGAHPGGFHLLPFGMEMFVSNGRSENPVTKGNWEGTGVVPDIQTPAEEALKVALDHAKPAALAFREQKIGQARHLASTLDQALKQSEALGDREDPTAQKALSAAFKEAVGGGITHGLGINDLGYRYLGAKKIGMAVRVLRVNTELFPMDPNAFDSLGEALLAAGQPDKALAMYRKALEIDPALPSAQEAVKRLSGK